MLLYSLKLEGHDRVYLEETEVSHLAHQSFGGIESPCPSNVVADHRHKSLNEIILHHL